MGGELAVVVAAVAYVLASVVAVVAFGIDKHRAGKGRSRVPERTLHALTVLGAPGALVGVFVLRHKTKKAGFLAVTALAVLVHVGAALALARIVSMYV